ncbi:unnamed protein product [Clavelina lepadiformis]|uniref:Aminotransferase class I/classII large domain-containing protein n=1 Tax=Clavelina lepadiformis TaxID=159417 RepID=A0ABP0GQ36_CLALP
MANFVCRVRHLLRLTSAARFQLLPKSASAYSSMAHPLNDFEDNGLLKPGHYSLQVGAPGPESLKKIADYLDDASKKLREQHRFEESLQYGVVPGTHSVREAIAQFLTRQYGQPVERDDLFVTSGASSGVEVLMKHYFTQEQYIFAENPTYPVFAMSINKDQVMKGVPIPIESDGLNLKVLEEKLKELPETKLTPRRPFRAAVYLIPTHHNPTGCCYSPEKCNKLVKLARKYDVLIICDDVYNVLSYKADVSVPGKFEYSPQRLFAYDRKTDPDYKVAPGLRMGWYEAPTHVITSLQDCYLANSGSGQTYYVAHLVAEALKSGSIDNHVQMLRTKHKERMDVAISTVEENLSKYGVTITHPEGGYFLWVKLPENMDSAKILELSKERENVTFVKGNLASICGDFSNHIRLCIAYYEVDDIRKGVEGLCRVIKSVLEK